MTTRIDTADVAKIARQRLHESFPHTTFRVNSKRYAGGSSVHVYWTDGPTTEAVERVVGHLHGAEFDGMIDLKSYNGAPYQNDFIFCDRTLSEQAYQWMAERIKQKYAGVPQDIDIDDTSPELFNKWKCWTLRNFAYRELRGVALS